MQNAENDIIALTVDKEITALFKFFLESIEELEIPQEKKQIIRKHVLDRGNDSIRQILGFLDYFDFQINTEKVATLAKERRVIKKVVTGSVLEYNK